MGKYIQFGKNIQNARDFYQNCSQKMKNMDLFHDTLFAYIHAKPFN